MNIQQAKEHLAFAIGRNVPAMLWGAPGIGKTDIVEQAARELGLPCLTEVLNTMESVDLRGLPSARNGVVEWSTPDFLARLQRIALPDGSCVLFIDEANSNALNMQAPLMQLALKRRIGPHELPAKCRVVFAGNRQSDRAVAQRMATALANRLLHIDVEVSLPAWLTWARETGIHPMVIAFVAHRGEGTVGRPGLLFTFDPTNPEQRAFASPRQWAEVSKVADAPSGLLHGLVAGLVGEAPAIEFCNFVRIYQTLAPIPSIVADPDGAPVPSDPSIQYGVAVALSRAATVTNFAAVLRYMNRVGPEFQTLTATDAVKRTPDLAATPAFIAWASANAHVAI